MKSINSVGRALLLVVALWLVMPGLWQVIRVLLPTIFMLLAVVAVVEIILGKFGKW